MEKVISAIEGRILCLDDGKVHYTMKRMHLRRISEAQRRAVKIFLACREFGMTIVPSTVFRGFFATGSAGALAMLHQLGDKGVLTLVKNDHPGALRYMLSERFLELWNLTETSNQQV